MIRWLSLAIALVFFVLSCILCAPPLDDVSYSRCVYDSHDELLRLTLNDEGRYRVYGSLAGVSPALTTATRLYEDRGFFWHPGINPVALVRAFLRTYVTGARRIGGSTLTMQVARLLTGAHSHTVAGKSAQVVRALGLELLHSKNELFEAYLNLAPYGHNIEGAVAASRIYFGKDVSRLSLAEASTLACIPQNPVARTPEGSSPALRACAERLFARVCLDSPALCDPIGFKAPQAIKTRGALPFLAPHFVEGVLQRNPSAQRLLTTLNLRKQRLVERVLHDSVVTLEPLGVRNASAMLIDTRDMKVLAAVGSQAFLDPAILGQVDGTRAKRSPGSTLKPFIYALALDQGIIHPNSMLNDAPARFGAFNPENFDGTYLGPVSARDALWRSRNVPAVALMSKLHQPGLYDLMVHSGVLGLNPPEHYGLALGLGGVEVTMEELVTLYAALANNGLSRPLRYLRNAPILPGKRLFSSEAAFMVRDMLATARRPNQDFPNNWLPKDSPVAWKTGTSYAFRDAWTVGIVGHYVLAVWMGNFRGTGNPALLARQSAAPAMFHIIDALRVELESLSEPVGVAPLNLTSVPVCAVSGQIPGPFCRHTTPTWFIPGVSPSRACAVHRRPKGEAWTSDLQAVFAAQGLPRSVSSLLREPSGSLTFGDAPIIVSPQAETLYQVRLSQSDNSNLSLIAHTDADSLGVHWFLNDAYIGASRAGEALLWRLRQGVYVLRAVDDRGRVRAQKLVVQAVR